MRSRPILLDTCALLWLASKAPMSEEGRAELEAADGEPGGLVVSPISAWEIGQLVARGRLLLPMEPMAWFDAALQAGVRTAELSPKVLVASSFLPSKRLRDPADRILAATARAFGYRLMTRDRPLLEFAAEGHVQAIAC